MVVVVVVYGLETVIVAALITVSNTTTDTIRSTYAVRSTRWP